MPPAELFDIFFQLDFRAVSLLLLAGILGLLLIVSAAGRLWRGHLLTAGLSGCLGLGLFCGAIVAVLATLNIITYQRLTYEAPIAAISFSQLGPGKYRATLDYVQDHRSETYELLGDEWQLDARVLRWKPGLQLLGADTLYRLERLNGRYGNIEDERSQPRTVYALARKQGLDVWSLAHDYQRWLKWLDAYYGSATYLPMQDGARFIVSLNQYGLMARPDNAQAESALPNWQ